MAEKTPQSFAHHARFDPAFHFFVIPVFAAAMVWSIVHLVRHPGWHAAGLVVFLIAALTAIFKIRFYALRVQDRLIRLEERLRLAGILPEASCARIGELTESQLVALRFASDSEVAPLVERALNEKLSRADIKKLIQRWRPDYFRV
ncbi:MAG TPA: DUF6526 family protein [Candidatus Sulfotelmatobacter sp.]